MAGAQRFAEWDHPSWPAVDQVVELEARLGFQLIQWNRLLLGGWKTLFRQFPSRYSATLGSETLSSDTLNAFMILHSQLIILANASTIPMLTVGEQPTKSQ